MFKHDHILRYLFVALGQNVGWIFSYLRIEYFYFIGLLFGELDVADVIENIDFLSFGQKDWLKIHEKLLDDDVKWLAFQALVEDRRSIVIRRCNCKVSDHDEATELYDELLEAYEVDLMNLSLMKHLNIKITDQVAYLPLIRQKT